jgi:hypothetical protein
MEKSRVKNFDIITFQISNFLYSILIINFSQRFTDVNYASAVQYFFVVDSFIALPVLPFYFNSKMTIFYLKKFQKKFYDSMFALRFFFASVVTVYIFFIGESVFTQIKILLLTAFLQIVGNCLIPHWHLNSEGYNFLNILQFIFRGVSIFCLFFLEKFEFFVIVHSLVVLIPGVWLFVLVRPKYKNSEVNLSEITEAFKNIFSIGSFVVFKNYLVSNALTLVFYSFSGQNIQLYANLDRFLRSGFSVLMPHFIRIMLNSRFQLLKKIPQLTIFLLIPFIFIMVFGQNRDGGYLTIAVLLTISFLFLMIDFFLFIFVENYNVMNVVVKFFSMIVILSLLLLGFFAENREVKITISFVTLIAFFLTFRKIFVFEKKYDS